MCRRWRWLVVRCCCLNRDWGVWGGRSWEAKTVWPGLEVRSLHRYCTYLCQRSQQTYFFVFFILKVNIYSETFCWSDWSSCLLPCRNHSSAEVGESPAAWSKPPRGCQRPATAGTHPGQAHAQVRANKIFFLFYTNNNVCLKSEVHAAHTTPFNLLFTGHDGMWSYFLVCLLCNTFAPQLSIKNVNSEATPIRNYYRAF